MNEIIKDLFPSYFPTVTSEPLQRWLNEVEQLFKQPMKQVFPYPIDVKKVYSNSTGKLIKMIFDVALAGIDENAIKVQLKKGKFLYIKIEQPKEEIEENTEEDVELVYSSKALSHRDGEITFKIFNDVDVEKFKKGVTFKNGLLHIELYFKEQIKDEDVIDASIE